jgi:hypothetical protein
MRPKGIWQNRYAMIGPGENPSASVMNEKKIEQNQLIFGADSHVVL